MFRERENFEQRLLMALRTRGHGPRTERAIAQASRLGEHGAVWLAVGAAGSLADRQHARRWRAAAGAVGASYVLNTAIKLAVRRRRPQLAGLPPLASTPTELSFPSAHAATSFAAALGYGRCGLPRGPLYAAACAMALSRLYLGVHHPSDVVAGALLGSAVAAVVVEDGR